MTEDGEEVPSSESATEEWEEKENRWCDGPELELRRMNERKKVKN